MEKEAYITLDYGMSQDVSIQQDVLETATEWDLMEVIEHPVFPKHEPP